ILFRPRTSPRAQGSRTCSPRGAPKAHDRIRLRPNAGTHELWGRKQRATEGRVPSEEPGPPCGLGHTSARPCARFELIGGGAFHLTWGLRHGERTTGGLEHRDVVEPVADRDHFSGGHAIVPSKPRERGTLGVTRSAHHHAPGALYIQATDGKSDGEYIV